MHKRLLSMSGPVMMLLSTLFFALGHWSTRLASREMSSWETVFWRSLLGTLLVLLIMRFSRTPISRGHRPWLLLRGLFGAISINLFFYAVKYSSLAKGVMLTYTFPLFGTLFALFLFRERVHRLFWLLLLVALGGIVLVINPDFSRVLPADLVGLGGGVTAGLAITMVRQLRHTDNAPTIFLYFAACAALSTAIPALSNLHPYTTEGWLAIAGMGVFTTTGQLLMTKAYQSVSVAVGSIISLQTVTFSTLLALAMGERHSPLVFWGGLLIILAASGAALLREAGKTAGSGR